jgi:transposase
MSAQRSEYFITLDTHCRTTAACIKTRDGTLVGRRELPTGIPQLRQLIRSVPHPRYVAFEEGSMAGWLYRNLQADADQLVVCDPRRNALIAKDGDKSDPIDAEKLNDLFRGGFLRPVHQQDTAAKAATKQLIGLYHDRVGHRIGEGNRLLALGKRWGLLLRSGPLRSADAEEQLCRQFQQAQAPPGVGVLARSLWQSWQQAIAQEQQLYQAIARLARSEADIRRATTLPGYGPIRAATLICYLDTPFRFPSKSALWKYVGIGLQREQTGQTLDVKSVDQNCNRLLRNVTIGAAVAVIRLKDNAFARRYAQWIRNGLSVKNARRNVARDLVTTLWGMWKTQTDYDPGRLTVAD